MAEYKQSNPDQILRFQIKRLITVLFKSYLIQLEDLQRDHDEALGKLHDSLPENLKVLVEMADYLSAEKADHLRQRVLRSGNDTYRAIEEELDKYEIYLKNLR